MTTTRAAAAPSSSAAGAPALRALRPVFYLGLSWLDTLFFAWSCASSFQRFGVARCGRLQSCGLLGWVCKPRNASARPRRLSFGIFLSWAGPVNCDETSARGELHVVDSTGRVIGKSSNARVFAKKPNRPRSAFADAHTSASLGNTVHSSAFSGPQRLPDAQAAAHSRRLQSQK